MGAHSAPVKPEMPMNCSCKLPQSLIDEPKPDNDKPEEKPELMQKIDEMCADGGRGNDGREQGANNAAHDGNDGRRQGADDGNDGRGQGADDATDDGNDGIIPWRHGRSWRSET